MTANNGNDILAQRALAQQILNEITMLNFQSKLDSLQKNSLSSKFPESMRLLYLSYSFLNDFFNKVKNLNNFQEFQ